MSSLAKMLSILDLFSPARPALAAEEIIAHLGTSQPTGYRYIQELCSAGLLSSQSGTYGLGVRIIELDYQMRCCDPLLQLVQPAMTHLATRLSCDVLLAVFFGDRVVVTRHEHGAEPIRVSFGRGRVMPLLRGAASKAILAALPAARQRRLYESMPAEIAAAGLGRDWPQFRVALSALRRAKCVVSHAELEPDNVGIAAALSVRPRVAAASLVLVFNDAHYGLLDAGRVRSLLLQERDRIDEALDGHHLKARNGAARERLGYARRSSLPDAPAHSMGAEE